MTTLRLFRSSLLLVSALLITTLVRADGHMEAGKNLLVIQADFPGMVMAGVAKSVSKDIEVFNVRPLIPLYDISAASQSLEYNAQSWPSGTVFVSVVDPGVGTARKSVVLQTKNNLYFVSPDNGSLSGPASAYGIAAVREIDENVNRIEGSEWSHTFHGRDVYSFTGARLAAGVISFDEVGPLLEPKVVQLERTRGQLRDGVFTGSVAGGTGYLGNIYFDIDRAMFESSNPRFGDIYRITISNAGEPVWEGTMPYARSFGSVSVGDNLLFVNSSGDLSVAINQGNFAKTHGIGYGSTWRVRIEKQR
ncbi:MAG: SAM-dependent chlorinase/fluorinase [Pseudomonadota bacterium]